MRSSALNIRARWENEYLANRDFETSRQVKPRNVLSQLESEDFR
jgi:hypothetical protein